MSMTCSTNQIQVQVDLEIESTLRRLRKEARLNTMAIARQQTLKELAAPNVENQPLCINIDNNVKFELKSGFIHLLPTFNGLAGEDPHTHLKEFHMVCVGMKPNEVDEEQVKLKAFPFSLKGAAKTWLFSILPGSIRTWNAMKKIFLEKYFPASHVGFGNLMERHSPNIGKDLSNSEFNVLIIKYPISCSFNISMKD